MSLSSALAPWKRAFAEKLVAAWYRGSVCLYLLRPLEAVFRAVAAMRRWSYRRGWLASYRPPVPVVVVGNITVGGTGKTPLVVALVTGLQQRGISVGVVSRGYGAEPGGSPHRVGHSSTAAQCGDEALLIYRRTGCPCVVAPSRVDAVRALLVQATVDLIISDDGLQHYALARDMEIVLLDQNRGIGNGFCLPAGPLREPEARLKISDYVLYRGGSDPVTAFSYEADCLQHVVSGEQRQASPAVLSAQVHAVAGIGQPQQFFARLRDLGFILVEHAFPDHHRFCAADFCDLIDMPIIMTEKDAVKCTGIVPDNAWYLKINARLPPLVTEAVAALVRR